MRKLFDYVRCARQQFAIVSVIALTVAMVARLEVSHSAENIGTVKQPLVGGTPVSMLMQEELGLLTLNRSGGSCSASLLNNDWAITAAHCVETTPGSNVFVAPGTISLTANWKTVQKRQGVQVNGFRPLDVAIVRVATPFSVLSATTGYRRQALGAPPQDLQNYPIEIFGRGINQFASGSGATAIPSQSDGQYRVGNASIGPFDGNFYWYRYQTASVAGGDSGGASFATIQIGRVLTGVHALCNALYVQGKPKTGWTWVSATPDCADAPVEPVWSKIQQIIQASIPPAPPPQYVGTFDNRIPQAVIARKRALYAENIDEPLVAPAGAAIDVQLTFEQCHKLVSSPGCPVTPAFEQWGYDIATHRLLHAASGKCLNISGARRDAGAPIILYPCAGAANEKWTISAAAGQSTWTVKSDFNGMCLHAIPGRRSAGPNQRVGIMTAATLAQMPCNASAAQRFNNVDANWSARNGPR